MRSDFANPLQAAIRTRDEATALRLIAARQFIRARDRDGLTALHWAAHHAQLAVVKALIAAGANLEAASNCGGRPLQLAVNSEDLNVVQCLIASGAVVNALGLHRTTPLHLATYIQDRETALRMASLLIEAGADVHIAAVEFGQSPLEMGDEQHSGFTGELIKRGVLRGFW